MRTNVAISLFLPTTSVARYSDFTSDLDALCKKHKAQELFLTVSGPHPDPNTRGTNATFPGPVSPDIGAASGSGRLGQRSEAAERAAQDFADAEDDGADAEPEPDAEPVKRGRGRPAGSKTGAGASSGERNGKRAEGTGSTAKADRRNVSDGADEGAGEGSGEGKGGARSSGTNRADKRGNSGQARVTEAKADFADGWDDNETGEDESLAGLNDDEGPEWWAKTPGDDEWPDTLMPDADIDEKLITELLAGHFNATGGKDRSLTFAVMEAATGERSTKNIHPDDYEKLVRYLLKDTARYTYGVKKPSK